MFKLGSFHAKLQTTCISSTCMTLYISTVSLLNLPSTCLFYCLVASDQIECLPWDAVFTLRKSEASYYVCKSSLMWQYMQIIQYMGSDTLEEGSCRGPSWIIHVTLSTVHVQLYLHVYQHVYNIVKWQRKRMKYPRRNFLRLFSSA